jgi:acetylornithine/N-succinyldiaminopimelate aminotransferase
VSLAELRALDRAHVVPTYARLPLEVVRGAGCRVWDDAGDEYLDFLAGISVANVGHCHPAVVEAVRDQAGRLIHASNLVYTAPGIELAARLAESSLGGKVWFGNSGAEANEAAIKLARKRKAGGEIVVLHGAFHGRTYGALSATPQESKQAPFAPLVPGFVPVAPIAEAIAGAVHDGTAAVLLEPVQGESGVHPLSRETLHAARDACDRAGALLIFDEVQTGMGRTGRLWAYEHSGVVPDALTTAKALGGGLPIGALVTTPDVADVLQSGDHGSTFAASPLVARAALAALGVCSDPALLERVRELGARLADGLVALPHVREVRGLGLMVAADLDVDAPAVVRRALEDQRLIVNATGPGTLRLLPPLIVTEAEIDEALARLAAALSV